MEKHTAKIFCLTIAFVLVGEIWGQNSTVETMTAINSTEADGTPEGGTTQAPANSTDEENVITGGVSTVSATTKKDDKTTAPAAVTEDSTPKVFTGKLKITKIGDAYAEFTEALEDSNSAEFKETSVTVCIALTTASSESSLGTLDECKVTEFTNGSIVATFLLTYAPGTALTADDLKDELKQGLTNTSNTGITVDLDSITVEEKVTTPTKSTNVAGLSTGAIVGIAVGSAVGGILLIGLLAFVIMKCKGGSSKVSSSVQELRPPAQQDTEAGKGDGSVEHN